MTFRKAFVCVPGPSSGTRCSRADCKSAIRKRTGRRRRPCGHTGWQAAPCPAPSMPRMRIPGPLRRTQRGGNLRNGQYLHPRPLHYVHSSRPSIYMSLRWMGRNAGTCPQTHHPKRLGDKPARSTKPSKFTMGAEGQM